MSARFPAAPRRTWSRNIAASASTCACPTKPRARRCKRKSSGSRPSMRAREGIHRMKIDEYAAWAATLGREPPSADKQMLAYLGLGLAGEAGEVADLIKKFLRDGQWNADALTEELGDLVYFWACLCLVAGKQPSQVLAASRRKIETR